MTTVEQRFWKFVDIRENGCWVCTRADNGAGYMQMRVDGKQVLVHRWSYEHFVGKIPEGMQVDHTCSNPACCNPNHLEPVTARENVRRSALTSPDTIYVGRACLSPVRSGKTKGYYRVSWTPSSGGRQRATTRKHLGAAFAFAQQIAAADPL